MMQLSDLLDMPRVEPRDLSATNVGIKQNIDLRTKAEIRRQRAFDGQLEAVERVHKYDKWPLESIGLGHTLGTWTKPQQEQHYPGGVQNMDMPVKRCSGLGRLLRVIGGSW